MRFSATVVGRDARCNPQAGEQNGGGWPKAVHPQDHDGRVAQ